MKTVILVRHAKAGQGAFGMLDFDRTLEERGKRDAVFMGQKIREQNIFPDLILSSPAKRAKKTAKLVADELGYPKAQIQFDRKIYDSNAAYLYALLRAQGDQHERVMVFGHNPDLSILADMLLAEKPEEGVNLPTAGVCCMVFPIDQWEMLEENQGRAVFFDYPKHHDE